jgi:hypothetical protein
MESSLTEEDIEQYLEITLKEIKRKNEKGSGV